MQTLLVRLKPYDPRRGFVLRRFSYLGIKFCEERGWYRVDKEIAEYLRGVRQVPGDKYSPLAFDVCTEAEARALDAAANPAKSSDELLEALTVELRHAVEVLQGVCCDISFENQHRYTVPERLRELQRRLRNALSDVELTKK